MSVLVQIELNAKPECVEEIATTLKGVFPETREFDGCLGLTAYLNDNGYTYIFVEEWESKEHFQKYFAWRDETGVLAALGELLQGPPDVRYFDPVDA